MLQGSDSSPEAESEGGPGAGAGAGVGRGAVVDCGDHGAAMLAGLHRLRLAGLMLDTQLWAEGVSFQVSSQYYQSPRDNRYNAILY